MGAGMRGARSKLALGSAVGAWACGRLAGPKQEKQTVALTCTCSCLPFPLLRVRRWLQLRVHLEGEHALWFLGCTSSLCVEGMTACRHQAITICLTCTR